MEKRLYRSRKSKVVAGVAGGLGEYLNIDPVFVRLLFVIATLVPGFHTLGIIAYIVLWVAVPYAESDKSSHTDTHGEPEKIDVRTGSHVAGVVWGTLMLTTGILLLGNNLFEQFNICTTWPLILVALGFALLLTSIERDGKNGVETRES